MLAAAGPREPTPMSGVIVPHAGYVYSGPVAASAYRLLPKSVDRVVLVGPSHFVPLRGVGASSAGQWRTPLGDVPVDTDVIARLLADHPDSVAVADLSHDHEHSLEVQVPFLQQVLGQGWQLVPLTVGHIAPQAVADVLRAAVGGPGSALLVVSTDLSHYHAYAAAVVQDRRTADAIVAGELDRIGDDDACGAYALRGALSYVSRLGAAVEQVDLRNSGDTAGSTDRVVGYGAFLFDPPAIG